jgi:hypothetical protein
MEEGGPLTSNRGWASPPQPSTSLVKDLNPVHIAPLVQRLRFFDVVVFCSAVSLHRRQRITKTCRLSQLTNSALVYEPKCGRGVAGTQPMRTAVCTWSPNKLLRSNSMFNLWSADYTEMREVTQREVKMTYTTVIIIGRRGVGAE